MTSRMKLVTVAVALLVAVLGAVFFIHASVTKSAELALSEYSRGGLAVDLNRVRMLEDASRTVILVDMSTGKFVEGPLVFRARDGSIYAVRDKVLTQLSGGPVRNLGIWFSGPTPPR